eukprot:GHVO01004480.1.p1 GENE.GHVO01004480.1~~GHVO01004480.1.p1  ORF type:complete len:555 (+),score=71.67 GHVO01004480.1:32-1696(+)
MKVRNVFGDASKEKFNDIKISTKTPDGNPLAAGCECFGVAWEVGGGGTIGILNYQHIGERKPPVIMLKGHRGAIQDLAFSPFYDDVLGSTSDDGTARIWKIGSEPETLATLTGHEKRVTLLSFNSVAESIVATSGADNTIRIWDWERPSKECLLVKAEEMALSLQWNFDCSLLACTSKDKILRVIDPRQNKAVVQFEAHPTPKPQRCTWLGGNGGSDDSLILTTGYGTQGQREWALYDTRNPSKEMSRAEIDRSPGVITPVWDPANCLIFLSGRGDGNIRIFAAHEGEVTYVSEYRSTRPAKLVGFVPKRAVDVSKCETLRAYKAEADNIVQPISFTIPRKTAEFQEDLFPPCPNGQAALAAQEWLNGSNATPLASSMKPKETGASAFPPKHRGAAAEIPATPTVAGVRFPPDNEVEGLRKELAKSRADLEAYKSAASMHTPSPSAESEEVAKLQKELAASRKEMGLLRQQTQHTRPEDFPEYVALKKENDELKRRKEDLEKELETSREHRATPDSPSKEEYDFLRRRNDELESLFFSCHEVMVSAVQTPPPPS